MLCDCLTVWCGWRELALNLERRLSKVVLRAAGCAEQRAELPCAVDDAAATAKFDKKKRTLTVRFPCRS